MTVGLFSEDLSIGELSTATALSIDTLRYYERVGLIEPVPRLENGHRRYSRSMAQRAEALSYLRATGMGIDDMRRYLADTDRGDAAATDVAELLTAHAARIAAQIEELRVRHAYIAAKATYWTAVAAGKGASGDAQAALQQARDLSGRLR